MQINRELTKGIPIQRHRRSNTPIVFDFVHKATGDPYAVSGTWALLVGSKTLTGVVSGSQVTFTLSDSDRATLPAAQTYKARMVADGRTIIPFVGTLTMSVTDSDYASFEIPLIRVEIDDSGAVTGGITVIVGPRGERGPAGELSEGAMNKEVYDTDNDGIVDNAAKIQGLSINQISINGGYF